MKTVNIKEFKALILRYESISMEEIERNSDAQLLTGFGTKNSCILCRKIGFIPGYRMQCELCVYGRIVDYNLAYPCNQLENKKTYEDIETADSNLELLNAFRNRAKHMRSILKKLRIKQP